MVFSMASIKISANARDNAEGKTMESSIQASTDSFSTLYSQSERAANNESSNDFLEEQIYTLKEKKGGNQPEEKGKNEVLCIKAEQAYTNDGKKIAFLTFDDGPSKDITPGVLETLDKYNVKATFFVLGSLCDKNANTIKKMAQAGNVIGIHTYSHRYNVIYGSTKAFLNEIKDTDAILSQILGNQFKTRLFRFPGGSFGKNRNPFKNALAKAGYVYVDWNALTGDGESSDFTVQQLQDRLKSTIKNRNHLVILMHDSESKSTTLQALPQIIEYLKANGYEFATLK